MADIRINALPTTATDFASDDYIAIDGTTNGTRKLNAKTANLTFGDVTFGSSGPSAKSSIAARAARQGLVFDGTAVSSTISVAALGSTGFSASVWVNISNPSGAIAELISGGGNNFSLGVVQSTGVLQVAKTNVAVVGSSTSAITFGKATLVSYVRSGTTGTFYINGVAGGTITDSQNYSGTISTIGSANFPVNGFVSPLIYNRALSAAEVVALYEAGVPAGGDYNTASNTAINTGAVANSSNVNFDYDTFTGASATGFTASVTSSTNGSFATVNGAEYSVVTGTRYLVTFSATLTSGTAPKVSFGSSIVGTLSSNIHTVTAGSNSVILTLTATGSRPLYFYNAAGESASFAISSLSVTRLGLLLAPDAGQAGGGLTWYDTSGNAANITLPASGVSWNVPTSSKVATGWTFGGNLTVSGTGTSSVGGLFDANAGLRAVSAPSYAASTGKGVEMLYISVSDIGYVQSYDRTASAYKLLNVEGSTLRLNSGSGGNVLVGTVIDGGQKLQVAGTAYVSGDATFAGTGAQSIAGVVKFSAPSNIGAGTYAWIGGDGSSGMFLNAPTGSTVQFGVNNSGKLIVNSTTIKIVSIPTSSAGLTTGEVWNDGGTLKIV